jgi:hypothetical protein
MRVALRQQHNITDIQQMPFPAQDQPALTMKNRMILGEWTGAHFHAPG